jgi:ABC-type iron transport system FetAB permease component
MAVLMSNFLEGGRERVELRLSRGANVWEAALPAVREAVEAALMPTVNAMAAAVSGCMRVTLLDVAVRTCD